MSTPLVSVISLTRNRSRNVAELLNALERQSYKNVEVILIDNCSADDTVSMVRRDFPWVQLLEADNNLGMVAYNLGFKVAQGDYILVIDDDGLPADKDWIRQIVQCFEENPHLGVASCSIRMADTGLIAYDSPQFVPEILQTGGYSGASFNGTGAGLRAKALKEVGYYPDAYFRTYLELHLCTRFINKGWKIRHFPAIEVWHSRPSGSSFPARSRYGLRNYYWYIWEFYPWPSIVHETLHEIGYRVNLVLKGELSLRMLLSATIEAIRGWKNGLNSRNPISKESLEYLRNVRQHGNWYGKAPNHREFHLGKPFIQ